MQSDDLVLLQQFREPATKEQGFTGIIKKYQEDNQKLVKTLDPNKSKIFKKV